MKTVIEMAREAGAIHIHKRPKEFAVVGNKAIERFAELVRADERGRATEEANRRANASWTLMCEKMVAAEREACEKVCDDLYRVWCSTDDDDIDPPDALDCKRAIRARGRA